MYIDKYDIITNDIIFSHVECAAINKNKRSLSLFIKDIIQKYDNPNVEYNMDSLFNNLMMYKACYQLTTKWKCELENKINKEKEE